MIEDAKRAWIEAALEEGIPVPPPRQTPDASGKFLVRMPRSLHRQVGEAAERDGVSLNAWVNVVLARAVGVPQRVERKDAEASAPVVQKRRRRLASPKAEAVAAD